MGSGESALDRVVVVQGAGQGSGVLLDGYVVLTAAHVVEGRDAVQVLHPAYADPVPCRVAWASADLDVALLAADRAVIGAERAAPLGAIRYGRIATTSPVPHCQIVGFPENQRYGAHGDELEYDQYTVSLLPMAGRVRDLLVCQLDQSAAAEPGPARDRSPLAGLSGAPVLAGAVLLGVVTQVPRDRHHLRIEAVPVEAAMRAAQDEFGWPARAFEDITEVHPDDERFEARYAADLKAQYRRTEIFGIEELGRAESRWDLDTAYHSLEAAEPGPGASRGRVETLLADRPRTLLRGEAGAGKTTLVWWLAAHAATGTLDRRLRELNHLVPFVVPLRKVHARGSGFPSLAELPSTGRALTEEPPRGWVRRVLEAGRGLLLVDGLDEVPERERAEAHWWLSALLERYPGTRCLATVRPNAVPKHWLAAERFTELTLLPMNDDDIETFVRAWHAAARLECDRYAPAGTEDDERALLTALEESLIHQLRENDALHTLARTPLLGAVICALHRRRGGLLPTTRWSLYRAALAMLLGGRDAGRGVGRLDPALGPDEQHALLQRIAIWLVRTGRQQMTRDQAARQLDLALRDMPQIRAQATTDQVLQFLLDRSGLLQERGDDDVQFIHRTFQDFLAAKEFQESGYVLELLTHARDPAWQDVVVMGAGHATRKDAEHLIARLIEFGDGAGNGRAARTHLHLLAARCAIGLLALDAGLMAEVRARVRALLPPKTVGRAAALAELGDWVVDLVPGPDGLDDGAAERVVALLTRVRSPAARNALRAWTTHPSDEVAARIVLGWDRQPVAEYAREVLSGMHAGEVHVNTSEQLAQVACLASIRTLVVRGGHPAPDLAARLPASGVHIMMLAGNDRITDLEFLTDRTGLAELLVRDCPGLRDLSALARLGLETLGVGTGMTPEGWRTLAALLGPPPVLRLFDGSLTDLVPADPLPNVRGLDLVDVRHDVDLRLICRAFPAVREIRVGWGREVRTQVIDLTPLHTRAEVSVTIPEILYDQIGFVGERDMGDRLVIERSVVSGSRER
ncbi:NACHT domain-containing protein [Streptomyces sp. NPDC048290]|uniref:NACHT domain-containing protein n=1 Tax=Streptomyces sp. NPDC048290 TaxID=3155811 RepID=UPI003442761C